MLEGYQLGYQSREASTVIDRGRPSRVRSAPGARESNLRRFALAVLLTDERAWRGSEDGVPLNHCP
jgi:hypothetical protein